MCIILFLFFFFIDTATTEIYTLSLHDALPISARHRRIYWLVSSAARQNRAGRNGAWVSPQTNRYPSSISSDRKSTRLNSSHVEISYAVFCLKKKKKKKNKIIAEKFNNQNYYKH